MKKKVYSLKFNKAITSWDEAIPLGNGFLGCLVWGKGCPINFSIDRMDLWDNRPAKETLEKGFNYQNLVNLVNGGEEKRPEVLRLFDDIYKNITPTKLSAGRIEFDFGENQTNINSSLDIFKGVCDVDFHDVQIQSFVSSTEKAGCIRIEGALPKITVKAPAYNKKTDGEIDIMQQPNNLLLLKYPETEYYNEDGFNYFIQKTTGEFEYSIMLYTVQNDEKTEIFYTVAKSTDNTLWIANAKENLKKLAETGFDSIKKKHISDWKKFNKLSNIDIPDKEIEKAWYLNNYFLYSCSRKNFYPMGLQGVWTADNNSLPPWKGDYHNDLNLQMSYYSYMKANRLVSGEVYIDYLWDLRKQAEKFSREFFDADGWMLPGVMTLEGKPLGGWPQYALNLVNGIWLAQAFDNWFIYTGDISFLKDKGYVFFKNIAKTVIRWLIKDENGNWVLPLSTSPEIDNNSHESWKKPNTNNDLALLKYLFTRLSEFSVILKNGEEDYWNEYLNNFADYACEENGALMINSDEKFTHSHRHFAHLMAIYPLHLISYDSECDKKIVDASVVRLEELGSRWWVGFSFTWIAAIYAVQRNGEAALRNLKDFNNYLLSPNGFHLNGDYKKSGLTAFDYRPFTLESNMGFNDALQEMLLQNHAGYIEIFPAIPAKWKETEAAFENLRTINGVLVSAKINENEISCSFNTSKFTTVKIKNNFGVSEFKTTNNNSSFIQKCKIGDVFELSLSKGITQIEIKRLV